MQSYDIAIKMTGRKRRLNEYKQYFPAITLYTIHYIQGKQSSAFSDAGNMAVCGTSYLYTSNIVMTSHKNRIQGSAHPTGPVYQEYGQFDKILISTQVF